ncbi:di-heme oxidoredictase family protein [Cerasicoccus arenae]|uniref:Thiol oxidoreductase n=1 Tax=Cerasicoccus arenae TaxID=424488 RepID=A0A8J3GFC2_9BACT|nr:di-heme oxidoredictase family protein [Cerasicoccus arenae]MBK1858591.1 c-type cytochrome [Cerasicoccus arenae]GHC05115.1 hypothetical protein GCM10007047_22610 [Cerasicoccus arenae]
MNRHLILLVTIGLAPMLAFAARIEFLENIHRIHWNAQADTVYLMEHSIDLSNWSAIGPVLLGNGEERTYDVPHTDPQLIFYRLLRIPADNFKSAASDNVRPNYVAWVSELADGTLRFEFYSLVPSDFADIHYSVNGGSQLNLRMSGNGPRWHYDTPPLADGDSVNFYFTYDREGPVEDTPSYQHIIAGDNSGGSGGGGSGGSGSEYEDVLPPPLSPASYSHGLDFASDQATIRIQPGIHPESMIVTFRRNGGPWQAQFMTKTNDEWRYSLTAEDGDLLEYYFYSITPDHIRSTTFSRSIGSTQSTEPPPLEILAAGRFRDRHENELRFDPYVENYFDRSYFGLTLLDYGDGVDVVFDPAEPMNFVDIKLYDLDETPHEERGIDVRADYAEGHRMIPVDGKFYWRIDAVTPGQFIDLEFTLQRTRTGQQYYTAIFRFFVGEGALTQRITDEVAWSGGATSVDVYSETQYSFAQAAHNALPETLDKFLAGKNVFDRVFDESQGLGPLYNAKSCIQCHANDGAAKPPTTINEMMNGMLFRVTKASPSGQIPHDDYGVQLQDRATTGNFPEGRGHVQYTNQAGAFGDGGAYSLAKPVYTFSGLQGPGFLTAITSPRVAPKIIGMGLLEAIPTSTLEGWEDPNDTNADGISGRINWVTDPETDQLAPGRFGWKAAQPSVSAQAGIALREDIGVSNPIYPDSGEELTDTDFDPLVHYTRLLGVPMRRNWDDPDVIAGEQLFSAMGCVACHVPTVTTTDDHPLSELSGQRIHPYTDLLLHDMGDGLADSLEEGDAAGTEWRTPPLWGIGRTEEVSSHSRYLHDGRARNLTEAILWHGGEGEASKEAFRTLPSAQRDQVIDFLRSL